MSDFIRRAISFLLHTQLGLVQERRNPGALRLSCTNESICRETDHPIVSLRYKYHLPVPCLLHGNI